MTGYLRRLAARALGEASPVHSVARLRARIAAPDLVEDATVVAAADTVAGDAPSGRAAAPGATETAAAAAASGSVARAQVVRAGRTARAPHIDAALDAAATPAEAGATARQLVATGEPSVRPLGPATRRADAAERAAAAEPALPDVHIHIGRVELAALLPPAPAAAAPAPRTRAPMSLDEYFSRRGRRAP